jgi:hypothetical protein
MKIRSHSFRSKHPIEKINVIGMGATHKYFNEKTDGLSIGVNDVYRHHRTNFLLCLDPPDRDLNEFIHIRRDHRMDMFSVIENSDPEIFFSNLDQWSHKDTFSRIQINHIPGDLHTIETEFLPTAYDSPFTAAVIAYKLGAKNIILYGVDFTSHQMAYDIERLTHTMGWWWQLWDYLHWNDCNLMCFSSSSMLCQQGIPYLFKL